MKLIITTILNVRKETIQAAILLDKGRILEVKSVPEEETLLGSVFVGKTEKVMKNLSAAFLSVSNTQNCYYSITERSRPIFVKKHPSDQIVQGDEFLVQVIRESVKTKLPAVSTNLSLTGRYLILTSENKKIGFSKKLSKTDKLHLQEEVLPQIKLPSYGMVFRTNSRGIDSDIILKEYKSLNDQMDHIIKYGKNRTAHTKIYAGIPRILKILQDSCYTDLEEIITDRSDLYNEIMSYTEQYPDLSEIPVRFYQDSYPLTALYNIDKQIEDAISKRVWLKSGAYLIIEPTEALTVIDINSGKNIRNKTTADLFYQINVEAAIEIARQIRLRNITGIILVDFINMDDTEKAERLIHIMKQATYQDPQTVTVVDFTRLNLLEITRQKKEKSLIDILT